MLIQQWQIAMTLRKAAVFSHWAAKIETNNVANCYCYCYLKHYCTNPDPEIEPQVNITCGQKHQTTLLAITTWTGHWWAINCQSISGCSGNQQLAEERQKFLAGTLSAFASGWRSWALGPLPGYLWKICAQLQWPTVNGRTIARVGFPVTVGRQTRIFFASGWSPLLGISDPR